jgi:ferric uptake regulation protein
MNYTTQLKSSGLKVTGPRLKILNLFETHPDEHMSAEDVYRILMGKNMDIGVATVYRVLTQFEEAGILTRHHFDSNKAVYELNNGEQHDHILCIYCGEVKEFTSADLKTLQDRIAKENDYNVLDHSFYIYGVCTACQQKDKEGKFKKR